MKVVFPKAFDVEAFARMLGGTLKIDRDEVILVKGICTDSREADAETAFVALRGERADGHDYIGAACALGARVIVCETESACKSVATVTVKDTECALSTMARAYRESLACHTIGVTGSVGKTTTKDMIASVLDTHCHVYCSSGNHNSVIGMPLSVMEIDDACECAVLEMGMSGFGEIERMSEVAQPKIAVITNIGTSHMEMLGSRENIKRAKLEILCGLKAGGCLLLNGDEPLLQNVGGKSYRTLYVSLSCEDADFFAQNIRVERNSTFFDAHFNGRVLKDLSVRVPGRHNVYAALYAIAVGTLMGVSDSEIRAGLLSYAPEGMRQNHYDYKGVRIIEDCYNASPESMMAALDTLSLTAKERRIAVLGEMLELGEESEALHKKVGAFAASRGLDRLFTVGIGGDAIAQGARDAGLCDASVLSSTSRENIDALCRALVCELRKGDTLLVKASRSVKLERVIAYLKEHY